MWLLAIRSETCNSMEWLQEGLRPQKVYHICLLIIKVKPFGLKLLVKNILSIFLQSTCRKMPIFLLCIQTYNTNFKGAASCRPLNNGTCGFGEQSISTRTRRAGARSKHVILLHRVRAPARSIPYMSGSATLEMPNVI